MSKVINLNDYRKEKDKQEISHKLTKDEEIELLIMLEKDNMECDEYSEFWEM